LRAITYNQALLLQRVNLRHTNKVTLRAFIRGTFNRQATSTLKARSSMARYAKQREGREYEARHEMADIRKKARGQNIAKENHHAANATLTAVRSSSARPSVSTAVAANHVIER
jgi:hypothetical protein